MELAIVKLHPDDKREEFRFLFNPEIHIPDDVTAIHHINDDDVKDKPTFREMSHRIVEIMSGCDVCGYNSSHFDVPMLAEELARAEADIDLHKIYHIEDQNIYHKMEPRTLSAAYRFYCGRDLEDAHTALADASATCDVLMAQIKRYDQLKYLNIRELAEFSQMKRVVDYAGRFVYNDKDEIIFNFGQYKGRLVTDILKEAPGFYGWMMNNDFPSDTKRVLTNIKLSMKR